jgi:uncharacterized protein YutD
MSQQEQQQQYDLSRLLKKPSKRSIKKKVSLPTPASAPVQQPKVQLPFAPAFVLQDPQFQTTILPNPLQKQQQRQQISILRDFVTGYVDFSAVEPISKQVILKFVKTFDPTIDKQATQDDLVAIIKKERKRFLRNQSQIQRRERLATIFRPSAKQLQQQQHLERLHDYIKGFDHDSVLNPISKQTLIKFVKTFNKDVNQQSTRQQLIKRIDHQKNRLLQLQWQQQ